MIEDQQDLQLCASIVEDELLAMEAIYPDCLTRTKESTIKLEFSIDFGQHRNLEIFDVDTTSTSGIPLPETLQRSNAPVSPSPKPDTIALKYLPPLILDLQLPPTYPLYDPPIVLSAYFAHSWMPQSLIAILVNKFDGLWLEQRDNQEGVLWRIAEIIVSGDFLADPLHIMSNNTITLHHPGPHIITPRLLAYDTSMNEASFSITTFFCPICLENRKGSACIRLLCDHIFCKDCLRDGWGLAVREGDCSQVRCPDEQCVAKNPSHGQNENPISEDKDAREEDVRRVLTEDEVKRWKWLRAKRNVDRDPTTIHCPLQFCQSPVPAPPFMTSSTSHQEESGEYAAGWRKLRTCDSCGYSFCVFCKRSWHGPIIPCNTRTASSILSEYLNLAEDSPRRLMMERSMGRENLRRMIQQHVEDEMNRKYMEESTTGCPHCGVRCEKSHGCNHMTCYRCQTHYCYRCGERLPKDPSAHFSQKGGRCYNKLFDFEEQAQDWIPMEQDLVDLPE